MYRCERCNKLFDEPKIYTEDLTPGGAFEGGSFNKKYYGCPSCEADYEEVFYNYETDTFMNKEEIKEWKKENQIEKKEED